MIHVPCRHRVLGTFLRVLLAACLASFYTSGSALGQDLPGRTPDFADDFTLGWQARDGRGSRANMSAAAQIWRFSQMQSDEAGMVVEDPGNASNRVMRFLWQPGEGRGTDANTGKKAHLFGPIDLGPKPEELWAFDLYFPSDTMTLDADPEVLVQWHEVADGCETSRIPPLAIENKNDRLTIYWRSDGRACSPLLDRDIEFDSADLGETTKDKWLRLIVHTRFDPAGGGALEVWRTGSRIVARDGIALGYEDQRGPYFGIGIYKYTGKGKVVRSYLIDNVRRWILDAG